jgi:two-component system, OmpR family, response regulator RstA
MARQPDAQWPLLQGPTLRMIVEPDMLDESAATPTLEAESRAPAAARPAAASLVLFVGAACRPGSSEAQTLAREGMRSLWLPGVDQALQASRMARFDALVLDAAVLDGRHGATLHRLREALLCPLVLLAERGDEIDEILALELGADAWLLRPVAPRRLRAHLSVLMRLRQSAGAAHDNDAPSAQPRRTGWALEHVTNRLVRRSECVALTEVQVALLQCLQEAKGRIVPRDALLAALPLCQALHARSVDVYVHRLRKRLAAAGVLDLQIEAVRGRGYVLNTTAV